VVRVPLQLPRVAHHRAPAPQVRAVDAVRQAALLKRLHGYCPSRTTSRRRAAAAAAAAVVAAAAPRRKTQRA
jgi:hypothetical protein